MYEFLDLTDAQKYNRRELLNHYATLAQLSASLPILVIFICALLSNAQERWSRRLQSNDGTKALRKDASAPVQLSSDDVSLNGEIDLDAEDVSGPSSPSTKYRLSTWSSQNPRVSEVWQRCRQFCLRTAWWMGEPVDLPVTDSHLGTRGEILGALLWLTWLIVISFVQTRNDYLHLTKRFGIIAASQLPLQYMLSLKTPFSPLQLLTRRSHETLNNVHQLLGRIISVLLYAHASLYLNYFVQNNLIWTKLTEVYVICGVLGILFITAITTTTLAPLRRWNYRAFYTIHVSLVLALMPVLYFHVSYIRVYLYETALIYVIHTAARFLTSKTYKGCNVINFPHTNVLQITVKLPSISNSLSWNPGQHAYMSIPTSLSLLRPFHSANPFTVSSLPPVDGGNLRFVARVFDGNTLKLAQRGNADGHGSFMALTVEGPYGLATHSSTLLSFNRVLFVAGGVGGSFVVPLYRQLLADLSPSPGSPRRQNVNFLWAVRGVEDMEWAIPQERRQRFGFLERLQVWVTQRLEQVQHDPEPKRSETHSAQPPASEQYTPLKKIDPQDYDDDLEPEERKTLLAAASDAVHAPPDMHTFAGRPDLRQAVDSLLFVPLSSPSSSSAAVAARERIAIVVCGPRALRRDLRRAVGRWVMGDAKGQIAPTDKTVWYWEEKFGSGS